ncbi:unnamed protein product [Blepharisma stoltei]|uniref:Uncharacterized protein n=1 Tax=Blepharisma stoltei TaxID=1481888 RepID=A0AAU9K8Q6_9CILI|nr:unnamed protein product [Blepharisma stoltei]
MHGPKYIETDQILKWSREQALQIHQKRLNEIKNDANKINCSPGISRKSGSRPQRFLEVERTLDIKKHNQLLLERLVEISSSRKKKEDPMSITQPIKSLNKLNRKKEAEKISNENERIARRLAEQKPRMPSKKKLDEEYNMYKKYKTSISKLHHLQTKKNLNERSIGSLPPIDREKTAKTARETEYDNNEKALRSQTPDFVKKKSHIDQRASSNSPFSKNLSPSYYKRKSDENTASEKSFEENINW